MTGLVAAGCGDSGESATPPDPTGADLAAVADPCPGQTPADPGAIEVGVVVESADGSADHVVCPDYSARPPTSGDHFAAWQNCGFYTEPVQDQTAVHSLEHGAVWIAYQPALAAAEVAAIESRVGADGHLLAAPYPGLEHPIVATAWTRQLAVDSFADPLVEQFIVDHLSRRSPTAPEAGASCEGAVGDAPDRPDARYDRILEEVG